MGQCIGLYADPPVLILAYGFKQYGFYYALTVPVLIALLARSAIVVPIKDHASWKPIDRLLIETFGQI